MIFIIFVQMGDIIAVIAHFVLDKIKLKRISIPSVQIVFRYILIFSGEGGHKHIIYIIFYNY